MTVEMFNAITRLMAATIPIGCVIIVVWYNRRTLRQMDEKLAQMREIQGGMRQMLLHPRLFINSQYGKESPN